MSSREVEQPTRKAVEMALAASYMLWKQLVAGLKDKLKLDGEDWHWSGVKLGWAPGCRKEIAISSIPVRVSDPLSPRSFWATRHRRSHPGVDCPRACVKICVKIIAKLNAAARVLGCGLRCVSED